MATVVNIASEGGTYTPVLAEGPFVYGSMLFAVCAESVGSSVLVYKSTDSGATWALSSSSGPVIQSGTIGFTFYRMFMVACADGDVIRVFYHDVSDRLAHRAFDMSSESWGSATQSSDSLNNQTLNAGWKYADCALMSSGKVIVTYQQQYEISSGVFTPRGRVDVWDSGSWSGPQTFADGSLGAVTRTAVGANSSRAHIFWQVGSDYNHVAMSPSGTIGSTGLFVASGGINGLDRHVRTWSYGGTDYVGLPYSPSEQMWAGWAVSADSPTWTRKQAFTKATGQFASHDSSAILLPVGASLHMVWSWSQLTGSPLLERVYKACIPYTETLPTFSTPEAIYSFTRGVGADEPIAYIDGYASGSQARILLGCTGAQSGSTYLRYLTESLVSCSACCCSNFAY